MKRLHTLVVLLGLTLCVLASGCSPSGDQSSAPAPSTNATPSTPST